MPSLDERVLILAPNTRDAELTQQTLAGRGLSCVICPDLKDFLLLMEEGAGLGLLAEESITLGGLVNCFHLLEKQPRWSDFPLVLIAAASHSPDLSAKRFNRLQQLGNLTILERPFHTETLITSVLSGLRDRKRQYEARSHQAETQQRENTITELNKNLESKVLERTQELTRSQDALVQAQKLEAIGRLAGGVAHDFNNLITGILGIVEDVSNDLGPKDPHREDLANVMTAANKASQLTRQLLAFGRRQVARPTVVMINCVIHDMNKLFSRVLPENVRVNSHFDSRLGKVMADKSQLEQVLLNLVLNAKDAMPRGGKIKITSANVTLEKGDTRALCDISPGRYVTVCVSDTGSGIDAETMKHLFEPFYTTKKTNTGTGMGLATAYGIIKQHGGDICVKSAPGKGTTFQFFLPRLAGTIKVSRLHPVKPHPKLGGAETILIAEDEEIVRKISVRALEKKGYRVIQSHDAKEALKLSKAHSGRIDLLLTDVVMPGMNGQELAAALKRTRPDTRILYMSGYSREMVARHGVMESGSGFIEKAFSAEKLCSSVREILDQSLHRGHRSA